MGILTLEHSKCAYWADFAIYGLVVTGLAVFLCADAPRAQWLGITAWCFAGLSGWTLIEYLLHRFVLHGLQPFRGWHAAHHDRPSALIGTPTVLTVGLFLILVFLPTMLLGGLWHACSLTLGVLIGYLSYALTHHAVHHWRADSRWMAQRKLWHAAHHHNLQPACYGVTSGVWDRVFFSVKAPTKPRDRSLEPDDEGSNRLEAAVEAANAFIVA